jgi:hypothetical protein
VVADHGAGETALPFQVLRFESNAREGKNFILPAQSGMALNDHMGMKPAGCSEHDVLADHTIGPNMAVLAELRLGMNYGRGMNAIHRGGDGRFIGQRP